MLVLGRKVGEKIMVGENIVITVVKIEGSKQVRIGIDAPRDVKVLREEIVSRVEDTQPQARETR